MMLYEDLVEEVARASWGVAGPMDWERLPEHRKEEHRLEAAAALNRIEALMKNGAWPPIRRRDGHLQIIDMAEVSGEETA